MTSPRYSITQQREAVEHIINRCIDDELVSDAQIDAAKQAVLTLGYLERNPDFARALALVMREFPEASVEVR